MIVKLETYVEVSTKEPNAVKSYLNGRLTAALEDLLFYQSDWTPMEVQKADIDNNPQLKRRMPNVETLKLFLQSNQCKILTPGQVLETMRKGLKEEK